MDKLVHKRLVFTHRLPIAPLERGVKEMHQLSTLCYIQQSDKTLMLYRNKKDKDIHKGKWNGLGGKFLSGETPEACVKREVLEESGLVVNNLQWRGVLTFPRFKDGVDWVTFLYTTTSFSGELIDSDEGELHWIETKKLSALELWEGDHHFFKWLEQPDFFSAQFRYENGRLIDYERTLYPK